MDRRKKIFLLTMFCFTMILVVQSSLITPLPNLDGNAPLKGVPFGYGNGASSSNWWNSSFIYRVDINITEPGYRDRINEPMNGYLTFEDQTCYNDTLRVLNYNGSAWIEYPVALWNTTWHASGYIEATSYTHAVNISQSDTETYYVYYSNINLGSPSYDYYPFEYVMYILSDLKLSAYYDDTDYQIFKWDYDNEVWDEPSDLNPYWIPSEETGTLDEYESYSKIENVNSPTHTFVGIYRVQSNKPITVAGGGLDGNAANLGNGYTTHVDGLGFGNATRYHISVFYGTASSGSGYKTHVYVQSLEDGNEVSV
ncbi:MAG: hypothetical protein ACTSUV_02480, partial [Candidatus Ranarchaeia archaeon]